MERSYAFKTLQIKARQQVYTLLSGNHLSKQHGEGYDFSELREYHIGDDVRKINWSISAKLGKPYIKELHSNRELSVVIAAMMGGSLHFAKDRAKQDTLSEIATILGYAARQSGDLFTGHCCTASEIRSTPPTKQLYHIEQFSNTLFICDTLGSKVDYTATLQTLFYRISRPSLLFVIGDFLENVDLSLLAQKHEVIAIIVRHREEEHPQKLGEVILQDPQSSATINTYFAHKSIKNYLAKLKEHDEKLIEHFSRYGIRYTKIFTDEEAIVKLLGLFRG
ncbi:MAG: DUF58 domain-containing protein [Campylobacterales bacterium]|nr:DUF58 domain-containing protein [Campylobacterales bacterium]